MLEVVRSSLSNNRVEAVEKFLFLNSHSPEAIIDVLEISSELVFKNKELANSGKRVLRYLVSLSSKLLDQEELYRAVLECAKECSAGENVYFSISSAYEKTEDRRDLLLNIYNESGAIRGAVLSLIVARLILKYRQSENIA